MNNFPANKKNPFAALIFPVALALVSGNAAFANEPGKKMQMYRYTNDKGVMVTGNSISPENARKGYQIVTTAGDVIQTIPPEPTAEERAKIAQAQQDKVSAAKQAELDKQLLLRYSNQEEIEFAKKRKITEIENKIVLLNSNQANIQAQIDTEQQRAATYERNGQPVPEALITKIDSLKNELDITKDQIVSRQAESKEETARFDSDMARLKVLEKNLRKNKQPTSN